MNFLKLTWIGLLGAAAECQWWSPPYFHMLSHFLQMWWCTYGLHHISLASSISSSSPGLLSSSCWWQPSLYIQRWRQFSTWNWLGLKLQATCQQSYSYNLPCVELCVQVNAGLLTSGIMTVYVVFLCWSAIMRYNESTFPLQVQKHFLR